MAMKGGFCDKKNSTPRWKFGELSLREERKRIAVVEFKEGHVLQRAEALSQGSSVIDDLCKYDQLAEAKVMFEEMRRMSTTSEDIVDFEEAHGTTKSGMWSFYDRITTEEGKVMSECKYCQKIYIACSSHGTSNMRRHLQSQCPLRNTSKVIPKMTTRHTRSLISVVVFPLSLDEH
ncbi:hypothetical protein RJ640_002460 [Escallonia rubra]|uniref:BED-type domain-containing protein n=1 Tax=Escallonia rubra TaxID=112253 RepID=A0AA88UUX4_9ASTE|nr:hypothetical protein RJ640_002460 [Escallonia rubra]